MIEKMISYFQLLTSKLVTSINRFPETILLATSTVITLIYMNHLDYGNVNAREDLTRIAMVLAIGIPLCLCIKVFFERKQSLNKGIKLGIYLSAIVALILYYLFMLKDVNNISISRYIAFSISLYLTFSFIPYFFKKENYELYVITLFNRFVTTYLYSVILFLGLVAIIFTINILFTANISARIYFDLWLIVVGIFAPAFFLADIPEFGQKLNIREYSKVLKVLLLYIVMPLIVAYSAILYVYFIKILVTAQWPQGILANLVLWFSIISTIVIFFIYPLRNTNQWVKTFISFFPKLLIPLLIMMFVSIGIRINAYGITENRYFVLVAGLWVTGCMLYYILNRNPKNIVFTISLAIISVMVVTGPLSGYSVSKFSQNMRFEKILKANNMISNDKIIKPSSAIAKTDREQISSILLYFQNKHDLEDLKYLPKDFEIGQTKDVFGFELEQYYWGGSQDKYFNYRIVKNGEFLDIKDYDYFCDYTYYGEINIKNTEKPISISYSEQNRKLEILENNNVIYNENIDDIANKIYSKINESSVNKFDVSIDEMTYVDSRSNIEVMYIFNDISGTESPDGNKTIHPPMFYIFVKIK
ncbi:DUF4153 domain-containing protein [Alkaliphilus sp. MSJ-5]|uniref:DUF4153 domain-containing protein n=1 Tax=Alkaliphilus flagellatus TaxID=2841507 RepID=A0ABS6G4B0_9FIRM|nr:DUF4153 domain-containing protein [Alkaliphilus flagellatus]MBU5677333.1 DUF4153 domain-containing protein [Alkaliphilus flagellatus]